MLPYTEAPNSITADIDVSSPSEIVQKLQLCDEEMFDPDGMKLNDTAKTLLSDDVIETICNVAEKVKDHLKDESGECAVVMSGCGTSGRIAFTMARTYNNLVGQKKFAYTIAGGDKALFTSQEAPEDDHVTGINDLIKVTKGKSRVLFIGITCGLSAPYVAGQLDYCMSQSGTFTPVLLGFNPIELARDVEINSWDKTFLKVARAMESASKRGQGYVINPVLMGEPITGSSRMKGGSITKVILDVIFTLATSSLTSFNTQSCKSLLLSYQEACKRFYEGSSSLLTSLVTSAGNSLRSEGHLYYVGSGECGVLGIIDATECTPTYGSDLNDVRGFIRGGYDVYNNNEGNIGHLGENYLIDVSDFSTLLSSRDVKLAEREDNTIIVIVTSPYDDILEELPKDKKLGSVLHNACTKNSPGRVAVVCLLDQTMDEPSIPSYLLDVTMLRLPTTQSFPCDMKAILTPGGQQRLSRSLRECWAKWLFNCTSTGGHILKGKVMKNFMIDVKVSNQKLFHRAISIIQRFCPTLSQSEARRHLVRSIHEVDDVDVTLLDAPVTSHIAVATPKDKVLHCRGGSEGCRKLSGVVPIAIVMSHMECGFTQAKRLLQRHHVVREALVKLTSSSS